MNATVLSEPPNSQGAPGLFKPDWIRIDEATRRYSISRSGLYEMVNDGTIKSVVLKKKRNVRGIRLLSTSSIDAMLESLSHESNSNPYKTTPV